MKRPVTTSFHLVTVHAKSLRMYSQTFRPAADPVPWGAGRPKFNQLEMVGHYLYLQTKFGEDRCTQFRVIVVTDPPTNTHKQTGPITIHCTAASAQCNDVLVDITPITNSQSQLLHRV